MAILNTQALFPSEFVHFAFRLPDPKADPPGSLRPFSFVGREFFIPIYDTPAKRVLLRCGRQTTKSTKIGNKLLSYSYLRPHFKSIYVTPTQDQTTTFSRDRLDMPIKLSPLLSAEFDAKGSASNLGLKSFTNGSTITLCSAYLDADSVRGKPANMICVDEIQDILLDCMPVIEACLFAHPDKLRLYAGTPKSVDNTIEEYWAGRSTMCEWMMPCDRCGDAKRFRNWTQVTYESIGRKGIICSRCGELVSPRHPHAQWASARSASWLRDPPESVGIPYEGYRIPQPISPDADWAEILDAKANNPPSKFANEVLGLSFDSGTKLVRRQALIDSSSNHVRMNDLSLLAKRGPLFMGIDWGGGGETHNSRTIVTIGGYAGDKLCVPFMKTYEGREESYENLMPELFRLIDTHRIHLIGTDYGGGLDKNDALIRRYGIEKIIRFQYCGAKKLYFDRELQRYMANRTECLMAVINALNRMDTFEFPRWESWEFPFASDLLNVFSEYNESNSCTTITRGAGAPDDTMHSLTYMTLTSMIVHPRPDLLTPDKDR